MKNLISIILITLLLINQTQALLKPEERRILTLGDTTCKGVEEKDIPTILIPGILASWYSEEGYGEENVKRWIPDPITHTYDTLIYTFKNNKYYIKDVFYKDEFTLSTNSKGPNYYGNNPKGSLYVWGYDWKKDNKISATLLAQLIGLILRDYEYHNKCNIGKVNIVAHSMGGLVARAMLEDMCVKNEKQASGLFDFSTYPKGENYSANGKLPSFTSVSCTNPYSSRSISKKIKVNKLVTIATPQRGSPKAFPIWEKGDIEMTDGFSVGFALKLSIGKSILSDEEFYKYLHGYEKSVPNGIVTIGQLLPDIKIENNYNNNLKYLYKNTIYNVNKESYPKNSFLEELNKNENIEKMFSKIENKYTLYYSNKTGYKDQNNIYAFNIKDDDINKTNYFKTIYDKTNNHNGQDIYDYYENIIGADYYKNLSIIRDNSGLGGDGTVPSYNSRLVPNDSLDGKEIQNKKFESKLIDCGQDLYRGFGTNTTNEACSHTNLPFSTTAKVIDFLALTNNTNNERKVLINNFGYASYLFKKYVKNYEFAYSEEISGIFSGTLIKTFFDDNYYTKKNENITDNFSLDLPGGLLEKTKSFAMYDILSPIDIMITDEKGRRIGIDKDTGKIINEIPGAWTSGRSGESGEREFFLIPVSYTNKVNHKIDTTSTGTGEYHIVMTKIDNKGNQVGSGFIIAGNAKIGLSEDYEVKSINNQTTYTDLTNSLPLILDIPKQIKTTSDKIELRYNIKGQGRQDIDNIKYALKSEKEEIIVDKIEKISGTINLEIKQNGKYILEVLLLDKNKKVLKTEKIEIEKNKQDSNLTKPVEILNAKYYKDLELYFFQNSSGNLISNLDYLITQSYDKKTLNLITPNKDNILFELDNDRKYKSQNKDFTILSYDKNKLIFKSGNNEFTYQLQENKIVKFNTKNTKFVVNYTNEGKIESIVSIKNILSFVYDEYTGNLLYIKDLYDNVIDFRYDDNIIQVIYGKNQEKTFDFQTDGYIKDKYKVKLEKIEKKALKLKLSSKKVDKLIKQLEKIKQKYLQKTKDNLIKKEIEYLLSEIVKILQKSQNK